MRKALRLLLPLLLAGVLAACGTPAAEIVMIPDAAGVDDGSFNQGAWDGVRLYAGVNTKTHPYYQPTAQSDKAYLAAIRKGVQGGAKIILLPGHAFQFAVSDLDA